MREGVTESWDNVEHLLAIDRQPHFQGESQGRHSLHSCEQNLIWKLLQGKSYSLC